MNQPLTQTELRSIRDSISLIGRLSDSLVRIGPFSLGVDGVLSWIPAVGEFVIPDLLGGPGTLMVGKMLWQEFFDNVDWPTAAAIAMALVIVLTLPLLAAQRFLEHEVSA